MMGEEIRKDILAAQEDQFEQIQKEAKGMDKKDFVEKAKEDLQEKPKPKKQPKKQTKSRKKERKIVGVKDLEAEFKIPGKTIRRHLRKMDENTKPRGPEPYQWYEDDKNFTKIRENLKQIVQRQPKLQAK